MIEHTVCLRFRDNPALHIQDYIQADGYKALTSIIQEGITPEAIIAMVDDVGLAGRGGAWFGTAKKWRFMQENPSGRKYLVVNSEESEPGTCKDTVILRTNPHQVIEGMMIAAYALGVDVVYHYIRSENKQAYDIMEDARAEAYAAKYVGEHMLGSSHTIHMYNIHGAGGYVSGEETALLESIEGKRPMPRRKPPFPAQYGLYACPTVVNNTETIASLPMIVYKGTQWYKSLGLHDASGVKIFSVSGHVAQPGVFELPLGMPFEEILQLAGGMRSNYPLKAVIPGGTSMKIIPAHKMHGVTMDTESIKAAGSLLGTGGIIVMDQTTCMVRALSVMMDFYHRESCGQCTPCREGSGWIVALIERIIRGQGRQGDVDQLIAIGKGIEGRTICAFGEAMAWPLLSTILHFREEFDYFVTHGVSLMAKTYGQDGFMWDVV